MHIAYIVSRFPSTTETFIAREMEAVRARGNDIELFALRRAPAAVQHPESSSFTAHTPGLAELLSAHGYWLLRRPRRLGRVWMDALAGNRRSMGFLLRAVVVVPTAAWFAQRCIESRIDHVHAHWATHSALAAWVIHRLTDLPFSITAHAHDVFVNKSMLDRKLDEAAFVAVISDFNARYLIERYPQEVDGKLAVVRCGVSPERYSAADRVADPECLRLVCVASLEEYKGHAVLLNALAELQQEGVPFRATLVGDGPLRPLLVQRTEELGLADRVEFTGALSSDHVASHLREADAFVLPSIVTEAGKMEGIPVALMEAGAARLPLVASAISGIPELVADGQTGLLVAPGDSAALAQALRALAQSPALRERLGRAAQQQVLSEFTIEKAADRLLELFADADRGVRSG